MGDDAVPALVVIAPNDAGWTRSAPGHPITDYRRVWPLARAVGLGQVCDDEDVWELEHRLRLLGLDAERLIDACQRHAPLRRCDCTPDHWSTLVNC